MGKTPVNDEGQMGSGTYKPQLQLLSSKAAPALPETIQPLTAFTDAGKLQFMDSTGYAVPKEICELFNMHRKDSESFWMGF